MTDQVITFPIVNIEISQVSILGKRRGDIKKLVNILETPTLLLKAPATVETEGIKRKKQARIQDRRQLPSILPVLLSILIR
jgi:hypothetical protein